MQVESEWNRRVSREQFLKLGGTTAAALMVGAPAAASRRRVQRAARGPVITHGVQSGDVGHRSAVIWSRADRPARMLVEVSATESFRWPLRIEGPVASPEEDLTAKVHLRGLPRATDLFYRVRFEDVDAPGSRSKPVVGHLRLPPEQRGRRIRDVSFVWGGDVAGQGWGINPEFGGLRMFDTMLSVDPDFFLHSGDTIYADGPLSETVPLPGGAVWRNVVTEPKAKVAETLDEFRGNHAYNLLDDHYRRFMAQVPMVAQWDDHETINNWYPGEVLADPRYTLRDVNVLAARAREAFLEYMPIRRPRADRSRIYRAVSYGPSLDVFLLDMRTYKGANPVADEPPPVQLLGPDQLDWLKRGLKWSTATWKVIAAGMPVGLIVPDGPDAIEAVAQADGSPWAREHEIAELLSFMKAERIRNTVWLTADVHYTAAHHYNPARATFKDFDPFWEFVAGPLHAGTFGPNVLDSTFGPELVFSRHAERPNQPPSDGLQFFGQISIDGDSRRMSVALKDLSGATLHEEVLEPHGRKR